MTNESHNGYIEVYLNLGLLGVGLIALILGQGYRRTVSAFRHDPALGGLLAAYVVTATAYNISEAGFRMLGLEWFFLLLAVVAASRVISFAETASESGRELADPGEPHWATWMSPDSAQLGRRVEAVRTRDAMARRYDHKERRTKGIIVESRKADD